LVDSYNTLISRNYDVAFARGLTKQTTSEDADIVIRQAIAGGAVTRSQGSGQVVASGQGR
jgi:3-keto-L-gulonate-6-phosphate decarboxylase